MSKIMEIQHQARENADELQAFIHELGSWQKEMEAKDNQLKKATTSTTPQQNPPKGSKSSSVAEKHQKKVKLVEEVPEKKIKSYDYAAWDKFDVDKALEELDGREGNSDVSEDEDENSEEEEALLVQKAFAEKDRGNEFFKKGDYASSIDCYTRGMQMDPSNPILPANRAMALLKQGMAAAAEADCTIALSLDSTYVKAYHRRANARVLLKRHDEACEDFKKVLQHEPKNTVALSELRKLEEIIKSKKDKPIEIKAQPKVSSFDEGLKGKFSQSKKLEKLDCWTSDEDPAERAMRALEKGSSTKLEQSSLNALDEVMPEMVLPIKKQPHQRSKKPLHRIQIKDVEESLPIVSPVASEEECTMEKSNLVEVISSNESKPEKESTPKAKISIPTKNPTSKVEEEIAESMANIKNKKAGSTPPKTSVQFQFDWRHLANEEEKAKYLELIKNPAKDYSSIFKQALEAQVFGEILNALLTLKATSSAKHILGLSRVPRMSTLAMFLGSVDQKNLKELLERSTGPNSGLTGAEITQIKKVFSC